MAFVQTAGRCSSFAVLVSLAEAVVLPVINGVEGDPTAAGTQAGAVGAGILVGGGAEAAAGAAGERAEKANLSYLFQRNNNQDPLAYARNTAIATDTKCTTDAVDEALPILIGALGIMTSLEYLNGFGQPCTGDAFSNGSATFNKDIESILDDALPIDWSGAPFGAAYNYECQSKNQQGRVQTIADADHDIHHALRVQASTVESSRIALAAARLTLIGAWPIVIKLYALVLAERATGIPAFSEESAEAILRKFLWSTIIIVIGVATTAIGILIDRGCDTQSEIDHAIKKYRSITEEIGNLIPSTATSDDDDVPPLDVHPKKAAASS